MHEPVAMHKIDEAQGFDFIHRARHTFTSGRISKIQQSLFRFVNQESVISHYVLWETDYLTLVTLILIELTEFEIRRQLKDFQ